MILVDTSIWVNHFKSGDKHLAQLLIDGHVMCHTYIMGELACGNMNNRKEIISLLKDLPIAPLVEFKEFLYFIDEHQLSGKGVGFVDIHLLASSKLARIKLWTADKRLNSAAADLGLNYKNN